MTRGSINRQFLLTSYPDADLGPANFEYVETAVPEPGQGEFLVRNAYISLDPAMRGWASPIRSYIPPVAIGEVMRAICGGTIVASCHPDFAVGTEVTGLFGLQDYALSDGAGVRRRRSGVDLPAMMGPVGVAGLTAYFGLLDVGCAREGDTVLVSAAAGSVGSAVVQIARKQGCRVVGIAGGAVKCAQVVDLGADACIDYKASDWHRSLRAACPDGIDVYFDNVGGTVLTAAMRLLRLHARVVICGAISQYNLSAPPALESYLALLATRSSAAGFVIFDYADRYDEAEDRLGEWVAAGELRYELDWVDGLENAPSNIGKLFDGTNKGKLLVRV